MKIDVIVPFHSKDRDTINWCIKGIQKHLDPARILVVCSQESRQFVESTDAIFFDEDRVVEGLTVQSFPHERWGWYFQQILKLGMADWVESDYYLVVDSDTVFFRDVALFNLQGNPLYAVGKEYHKPYFDVFERLLGFSANREYSFLAHHMVFNKHIVREMRERFPEDPWHLSIIRYVEPQSPWHSLSQFSEYEIYGHYIKILHPDEVNLRPLKWIDITLKPSSRLFQRLSRYYDYCSLHAYLREDVSIARQIRNRIKFELKMLEAHLER
jgi:hypothetical protein